jgi:cysteine desulfurase
MSQRIYLDYAAATPMDERVEAAMRPFWREDFYNPSSSYLAAKAVKAQLDDARARVAHWLGAKHSEVIFTAGATESINLAINGVMQSFPEEHVLVSAIEHDAVLAAAQKHHCEVVPVLPDGTIDLEALRKAITDHVVLISVGIANNEVGTIQPIKEIAAIISEVRRLRQLKNNQLPLYLHTDASQAGCYLDLHTARLGIDLLSLNGGKMYGPKQSGALFIKTGVQLTPQVFGGGQERGIRSGTENVAGSIGLATAFDIAQTERKEEIAKIAALRDELQRRLQEALPNMVVDGNPKKHLPHILHVNFPGVDGERLLMQLDEAGIMASTGSACAANKQTASHVLRACGFDDGAVQGSLRLSLGRFTTPEEVTKAVVTIVQMVK